SRSLTLCRRGGAGELLLERLDPRLRPWSRGVVRRELDEPLVGCDRGRVVADALGRLRELELDTRIGGLELGDLLVGGDQLRRRLLVGARCGLGARGRVALLVLVQRGGETAERPAER